jgi:hypothetical protein
MIFDTPTTANNAAERIALVVDSIHSNLEQAVILAGTAETIFGSVTPYSNNAINTLIAQSKSAFSQQLGPFINAVGSIDSNTAVASSLAGDVLDNYGSYLPGEIASINADFSTIVTTINSYDTQVAEVMVSTIDNSISGILPALSKTVRVIPAVSSSIVASVVANNQVSSGASVIIDGVRNNLSVSEISSNLGQSSLYNAVLSTRNTLSGSIVNPSTPTTLLSTLNSTIQSLKGKV